MVRARLPVRAGQKKMRCPGEVRLGPPSNIRSLHCTGSCLIPNFPWAAKRHRGWLRDAAPSPRPFERGKLTNSEGNAHHLPPHFSASRRSCWKTQSSIPRPRSLISSTLACLGHQLASPSARLSGCDVPKAPWVHRLAGPDTSAATERTSLDAIALCSQNAVVIRTAQVRIWIVEWVSTMPTW